MIGGFLGGQMFLEPFFPSCVSGRGYKIGPVCLSVRLCVCLLALYTMIQGKWLLEGLGGVNAQAFSFFVQLVGQKNSIDPEIGTLVGQPWLESTEHGLTCVTYECCLRSIHLLPLVNSSSFPISKTGKRCFSPAITCGRKDEVSLHSFHCKLLKCLEKVPFKSPAAEDWKHLRIITCHEFGHTSNIDRSKLLAAFYCYPRGSPGVLLAAGPG